jgi:hypothetical protein
VKPIEVAVTVPAPVDEVWDDAAHIDRHVEWMADAHALDFLSEQQSGAGTRIAVETRVGPLRTTDVMEFTAWEPPRRMAVKHSGLFSGTGEFLLEPVDGGATRFTWRENIRFPWFLGGPAGALAARPILTAIWRRNLRRFAARFPADSG